MAKTPSALRFSVSCQFWCAAALLLSTTVLCNVVFQPSFLVASGPKVSAFLLGNASGISLILSPLTPINATEGLPPPSCEPENETRWLLSRETVGPTETRLQLVLNRSLALCGNETDCCPQTLCVYETLRVSACLDGLPQASLLVQARIYAQILPSGPVSGNKTVVPNQVFQPLGVCPCDLSRGVCDVRCCCDQDCSPELLWLFEEQCLPGPFGGYVTPVPEFQCSAQASANAPDWFPFLCVTSPSDNSPFLGIFYQGDTITPQLGPSFQSPEFTAPVLTNNYRQGAPIFTVDDRYFTIPQRSLIGQCVADAPVAFLEDFEAECVTHLQACPSELPELTVSVRDGLGGVITVNVVEEVTSDPKEFLSPVYEITSSDPTAERQECVRVTVSLRYTLYWRDNGLTGITAVRTTANITQNPTMFLTQRFSAVYVNGNLTFQPHSGHRGYVEGRPVIGGFTDSETGVIQAATVSLWKPAGDGVCQSGSVRPVVFRVNATSGCLFPVSLQNITQCSQLRDTVRTLISELVTATLVARTGNPDVTSQVDWISVTRVAQNSSLSVGVATGVCTGVPAHLHIHIRSLVLPTVGGATRRLIESVEVSQRVSTWHLVCGGGGTDPCVNLDVTQFFPVTSSVTFTDRPLYSPPPRTRFQINFTEYDCERNDVCWPELAFPLTRYYTGEPYSQSLAKGLILVFFFIAASVLGSPWRQIRQAWRSSRA
ncbi:tectonic-2 [Chanos chanos]|uniref:Tectonic-2 n=1 Tax=Chanos chanos TaxID=29144 RepID=A0A6J2WTL7_CHACN|nr:tectonic-2 [Chanos chanos]